jgi:hypothetical protein
LGKTGLRGTIINLLTGVADPAGLLVGAATAGSGFLVAQGRAAYTAGQMGLGALGAGVIEAGLYGLQETKPAEEILEASITGALFQGGLGQFGYRPELQAALTRDLHKAAQEYRKASTAYHSALEEHQSTVGAQQSAYVDDLPTPKSVSPSLDELREEYIRKGNDLGAKYAKLRLDASGWLLSRNQPTAKVLSRLGQDPIGIDADNKAIGFSAEEYRNTLLYSTHTNWLREYGQAFKEFDQGNSWFGREKRRKEFNARIADLYEMNVPESAMSPAEAKAVKATRAFFEEYKRQLQESGIVGPDGPIEILNNGPYLPHILDHEKIRKLVDETLPHKSADLVRFLSDSMWSKAVKDNTHVAPREDLEKHFTKAMGLHDSYKKSVEGIRKAYQSVRKAQIIFERALGDAGKAKVSDIASKVDTPEAFSIKEDVQELRDFYKAEITDLRKEIGEIDAELKQIKSLPYRMQTAEGLDREVVALTERKKGLTSQISELEKLKKETSELDRYILEENEDIVPEKTKKGELVKDAEAKAQELRQKLSEAKEAFKEAQKKHRELKKEYYESVRAYNKEKRFVSEYQEKLIKAQDRIARGYVNNVLHYGQLRHVLGFTGVSHSDAQTLRAVLSDAGTDPELVEKIVNTLGVKASKPGTGRLKARVDFDMNYTMEFPVKEGPPLRLSMSDIFNRDLDSIIPMYGHQMAGHIGVAKATGIKSKSEFMAALNKYKEEAVDVSDKEISKTISYSNYLYDAVTGVPLDSDPSSFLVTWGRRARDFNFAVRGGQFVWSQLTEAAPMLANIGLPALYKQMPELKNMVTLAADGKLNNELVRQLEAVTGIGASRLRQQIFTHFNPQDGVVVQGVDKALHKVGNFVSDVSGFNAVIAMEQRMMLAGMSQKLVDMAKKYKGSAKEILKKESSGEARNLRSLGLSDEQLESLFAHLADPSKVQFGKKGRVHVFKEDQWDPDVWNGFAMALHRLTTTVIQEGTYGGTIPFMHKAIGKLLFQFRSFAMNGIYKQTMRGVAIRDQVQWLTVAYGFTFGMLSYIAQTYDNYRGTDTYEARMSPQKIVEGTINRMGQASMLPAMVGWISGLYMGKEPLFNYARSSGLGSDIVQSIPSVHLLDDMYNGGLGSLNALLRDDYDFTKKEYRALLGLMPLASIPVLKHFFQYAGEDLPSKNVQDYGLHR